MSSHSISTQSDPTVWIFLHLPKTGGTTINGHFRRHMSWDESFVHLGRWGHRYRKTANRKLLQDRSDKERARIKVISGHHAYYGVHRLVPTRKPKYFTIVRDPAQRCVSRYNFNCSKGKIETSFEAWYASSYVLHNRNDACRFLAERAMNLRLPPNPEQNFRLACQLLDACWHVCLTENLSSDLAYLFSDMNLPTNPVSHRVAGQLGNALAGLNHPNQNENIQAHYRLTDSMRTRINEDHVWDVRLYQYARQLNERQWNLISASDSRTISTDEIL